MIAIPGRHANGHRDPSPVHQADAHHAIVMDDGHVSGGWGDVGHCAEWGDYHQDPRHGVYPLFPLLVFA